MDALLIFTTTLSIGTLVLCLYTDLSHEKEERTMLKLIRQHDEIVHHMINIIELLEQRIKKLEEEVKKGENDGRTNYKILSKV